jgi:large subunit ribosomal protein L25
MKTIAISAKKRTDVGKKSTRELRKNEQVPCVMYGGEEVVHFHAHENDFRHVIFTPDVFIIEFDIDGEKRKAIMQEVQFHPVTDSLLHMDFVEVFDDRPFIINLPIKLTGSSIGVKNGGKTRQRRRVLKVKGLSKNMPDFLEIDITNVDVGDVIKIGDLSYENLEILDPSRSMIFSVVSSRLAMKGMELVEPETEEVEGEEGAEATEEGETAPEGEAGGEEASE